MYYLQCIILSKQCLEIAYGWAWAGKHEGKKPYTCNLCGVSFAWKNNLTTHIDGVHRGIKKQYKKKIRVHI